MKSLKESLFDDNLVSKDIRFGDMYELECVYMKSPFCFNKLYTKRIISQHPKWSKEKDLKKYWEYYGADKEYEVPPAEIEGVCNVIIHVIENFPMKKAQGEPKDSGFSYAFIQGPNDPFSNALRQTLHDFIYQYVIGMHPHNIYVDTNYKYGQKEGYVQVKIGKNTYKGRHNIPDRMEFIFKKK